MIDPTMPIDKYVTDYHKKIASNPRPGVAYIVTGTEHKYTIFQQHRPSYNVGITPTIPGQPEKYAGQDARVASVLVLDDPYPRVLRRFTPLRKYSIQGTDFTTLSKRKALKEMRRCGKRIAQGIAEKLNLPFEQRIVDHTRG